MRRAALHLGSGLALACAVAVSAHAATFPSKPIRFTVGQSPGGATDLVARAVAQRVTESIGQSVVVENRTGAAGSIAATLVAKAPADGHTLLFVSSSFSINPSLYSNLPFDPQRDFAPVALIAEAPFVLVVHPSLPVHTVRELIQLSKARGSRLNFASGGPGSSGHLAGELFKSLTGAQMTHVPYKGAGPALIDVIAGQVDLIFASVISTRGYVQSGKLRALGVTGLRPSPALPGVPTISDSGVKGYNTGSWYGVLAPAGTPADVVGTLNSHIVRALNSPDLAAHLSQDGAEPRPGKPADFQKFLAAEIAKWQKLVRDAHIMLR